MPETSTGQSGTTTATGQENTTTGQAGNDQQQTQQSAYTPPATQADLDRIVESRLQRERAKYAGFDDLKAKATKFDELEQANKTELEKATSRADKAEKELAQARAAQLRTEVAIAKQLPAELAQRLSGTTREELEADADKLAGLLAPKQEQQTNPGQGVTLNLSDANSGGDAGANDAAARAFFGI